MKLTKIVGYFCLMVGFVGLLGPLYQRTGVSEAMAIHQFQNIPQQESYSRGDVLAAMKKAAAYTWDKTHSVPVPGVLIILVGVILVDVGSRQKKIPSN
jgi:hypothetical protein